MAIEKVNLYPIALPFAGHFPHALNKGGYANNVVCEIVADGGRIKGYGEGAPRTYVTGETPARVMESIVRFVRYAAFPRDLESISQIWDFIDGLPKDKSNNAAVCALECAWLDALGKKEGRYLTQYFPAEFFTETIRYGAAIPLWNAKNAEAFCRRIKDQGIRRIKLKMGKDLMLNHRNLEIIRTVFDTDYDLKIDANGSWNKALAMEHAPLLAPFQIRVIEQPMAPRDPHFSEFAERVTALGVFLMADESICSLDDVDTGLSLGFTMVNIRLSKCGGFRRSIQMLERLREKRVPFQIGCHLGESGILSAAGRILSLISRDALYHDGSYDMFLLKENITTRHVSFGKGGAAGKLEGFGLGVEIDPEQMNRLSETSLSVPLF